MISCSIHLRLHEEKNKPDMYFEKDEHQIRVLRPSFLEMYEMYEIIRKRKRSGRTTRLLLAKRIRRDEAKRDEHKTNTRTQYKNINKEYKNSNSNVEYRK